MAGNVNRGGGGMVYHWKHGWIPRTPGAALQKAHGSHKGASKLMSAHGIKGDLPGGHGKADAPSKPDAKPAAKPKAAGPKRFTSEELSSQVKAMGIGGGATHVVRDNGHSNANVAHKPDGSLAYFKSKSEADRFARAQNDAHAAGQVPSYEDAHKAKMAAIDAKNAAAARQSLQNSANMHLRKPASAATPAAHAKVRDLPAGDTFKGVHSETHKGEKLSVRKGKQYGELETQVNGHTVGIVHGTKNSDAVKQLDSLRGTVDHAKANPAGYINGNGDATYGMKLDKPKAPAQTITGSDMIARSRTDAELSRLAKAQPEGSSLHRAAVAEQAKRRDAHTARAEQLRAAAAKKRDAASAASDRASTGDTAAGRLSGAGLKAAGKNTDASLSAYTKNRDAASHLDFKARLAEGNARVAAAKGSAARLQLTADKVSPGDSVTDIKGRTYRVAKVNRTTLTLNDGSTVKLSNVAAHEPRAAAPERSFSDRLRSGTTEQKLAAIREAQMPTEERRKSAAARAETKVVGNAVTYQGVPIGHVQKIGSLWYDGSSRHFKTKAEAVGALVLAHRP